MAIVFAHVLGDEEAANAWLAHAAFADANSGIFRRSKEFFEKRAKDLSLIAAREDGRYVGLCYYYAQDEDSTAWEAKPTTWEVGGLVVAADRQNSGVGRILAHVVLGALLSDVDPIPAGETVLTEVLCDNPQPRRLIEDVLGFSYVKTKPYPRSEWPGAKADSSGNVLVDVFTMSRPETLQALAHWCEAWAENWHGQADDQTPVRVVMRDTPDVWARLFWDMAT